jgi:hypothetical protein
MPTDLNVYAQAPDAKGSITTGTVQARVATLEHALRRQQRITIAFGAMLIALATLAAADKVTSLKASKFALEDAQGKTRATLALDEAGSPMLTFMTAEGIVTRAIGPHDETPARLAELERLIQAIPRVAATPIPAGDTTYRLANLERETVLQREQLVEQQRLAAQAQDQLRMEQDQKRRDQERLDVLRRNERMTQP